MLASEILVDSSLHGWAVVGEGWECHVRDRCVG